VSGAARTGPVQRIPDCGNFSYLRKPVAPVPLVEMLEELLATVA